ncbi:hypothetical protein MTR67_002672, partial [Solanum verrucosum]
EAALIGPNLVYKAMEKVQLIRDRLKTAQSRQKSFADVRRKELEFQVDYWIFLKVSPMNGVMRFGKKGKPSPRYVGPYRILKRIGKVAYKLELSADLAAVHPFFHISLLKKCVGDPESIVPLESVAVKDSLSVFACSWNSVQSEIQFSVLNGGTHRHHPWTVGGPTVRPRVLLFVFASKAPHFQKHTILGVRFPKPHTSFIETKLLGHRIRKPSSAFLKECDLDPLLLWRSSVFAMDDLGLTNPIDLHDCGLGPTFTVVS